MNVNWLLRRAKTLLNVLLFALLLKYPCKYAWHIVYKVFAWIQYQSPNGYSGDYNYSSEVASPPLPFPSYPGRGREWIKPRQHYCSCRSSSHSKNRGLRNKIPIFLYFSILFQHQYTPQNSLYGEKLKLFWNYLKFPA